MKTRSGAERSVTARAWWPSLTSVTACPDWRSSADSAAPSAFEDSATTTLKVSMVLLFSRASGPGAPWLFLNEGRLRGRSAQRAALALRPARGHLGGQVQQPARGGDRAERQAARNNDQRQHVGLSGLEARVRMAGKSSRERPATARGGRK